MAARPPECTLPCAGRGGCGGAVVLGMGVRAGVLRRRGAVVAASAALGGQNILQSTLQYGYEHFLEQVNLAEQLTSKDFGISTGLINQNYWENSKWYYVNVERGNAADKLNGRNINVSFTNNSNVPVEVMVFIFYSDEIAIDVKTGLVTRHRN